MAYRNEAISLFNWCQDNNLDLNVDKTKEMIIDFRKFKNTKECLLVNGKEVENVSTFKLLGILLSDDLKFQKNNQAVLKKARQRLFFLRTMKSAGFSCKVMHNFYKAIIESVLTYAIIVWGGSLAKKDKRKLDSFIRVASRLVGCDLPSTDNIYLQRLLDRAKRVVEDQSHPSNKYLVPLPSGRRYRSFKGSTRFLNSTFPEAVRVLNGMLNCSSH